MSREAAREGSPPLFKVFLPSNIPLAKFQMHIYKGKHAFETSQAGKESVKQVPFTCNASSLPPEMSFSVPKETSGCVVN